MSKLKIQLLIFLLAGLAGCKSMQQKSQGGKEAGMFRVTILYPNGDDKTFDMDYYEKKHMPMVAGILGDNLRFYEIDKGISGRAPGDKPPFLAIGYFYVNDVAAYSKAIAQNRETVISDFRNYTNAQPVVQISQIQRVQ